MGKNRALKSLNFWHTNAVLVNHHLNDRCRLLNFEIISNALVVQQNIVCRVQHDWKPKMWKYIPYPFKNFMY